MNCHFSPFPFLSFYMPAAGLKEALMISVVWILVRSRLVKVYSGGEGDRPLEVWWF